MPVLIDIAENEREDVIAEIAAVALGRLGDRRAIPALQAIERDDTRDPYVRAAARAALADLSKETDATAGTGRRASGDGSEGERDRSAPGQGDTSGGERAGSEQVSAPGVALGPAFADKVLAVREKLTFAAGDLRLSYDSIRKAASVDGDLHARFDRSVEETRRSFRYGAQAALVAGVIDYEGDDSVSRQLVSSLGIDGEGRYFMYNGPWYAFGQSAADLSLFAVKTDIQGVDDHKDFRLNADLHAGVGIGRGRVLDIGPGLRLRRIERLLGEARLLGRPITDALARQILRAWWALRHERGLFHHLHATIELLRNGGVLLEEPDAATTYRILQALQDGQLDYRPNGLDVRTGIAGRYAVRDEEANAPDGQRETAFARAAYARQSPDGARELIASGAVSRRIFAADGDPSPWLATAEAAWRHYFYSDEHDPIGALEIACRLGGSDNDLPDTNAAWQAGASLAWSWVWSRASRYRIAADISVESSEIFVGLTLGATYGLVDGSFIAPGHLPPPSH